MSYYVSAEGHLEVQRKPTAKEAETISAHCTDMETCDITYDFENAEINVSNYDSNVCWETELKALIKAVRKYVPDFYLKGDLFCDGDNSTDFYILRVDGLEIKQITLELEEVPLLEELRAIKKRFDVHYHIWITCLCGNQVMVWDKDTHEQMGYDDSQENVEPMRFDTFEEAKEYCEFSNEYVKDNHGNVLYIGEVCDQCMATEENGMASCENCGGTGKVNYNKEGANNG